MTIGIRVTYQKETEEVTEEFQSIFQCACHFQIGYNGLKKIIQQQPILSRGKFPTKGLKIELFKHKKKENSTQRNLIATTKWMCPECQIEIQYGSKTIHLHSKKHLEKIQHQSQNVIVIHNEGEVTQPTMERPSLMIHRVLDDM